MNDPQRILIPPKTGAAYDLAVIGGGPAGFFGALSAAEANPGLRIVILERGSQLLAKVRISGGGRCNVTHACFDPAELVGYYPRGSRELRGPFTRFQPADTVAWFEARGVSLKAEADGRMFPVTDKSETVIDCLLTETAKAGIEIRTRTSVAAIIPVGDGFELKLGAAETLFALKVLIAAGGGNARAYDLAANLGHTLIPPVPSLFTFKIRDPRLADLAGISVPEARLSIRSPEKIETSGPLLITHWGLSGPAALKLSAWGARALAEVNYRTELIVNWVPAHHEQSAFELLKAVKQQTPRQQVGSHPQAGLPSRLWGRLCAATGIAFEHTWAETSHQMLRALAGEMTAGFYQIEGKGVFKEEFVTAGGVALKEVDFRKMESRIVPGVYFAGEYLDIDGLTGGFNFQAAWTTGWLAGQAAAPAIAVAG